VAGGVLVDLVERGTSLFSPCDTLLGLLQYPFSFFRPLVPVDSCPLLSTFSSASEPLLALCGSPQRLLHPFSSFPQVRRSPSSPIKTCVSSILRPVPTFHNAFSTSFRPSHLLRFAFVASFFFYPIRVLALIISSPRLAGPLFRVLTLLNFFCIRFPVRRVFAVRGHFCDWNIPPRLTGFDPSVAATCFTRLLRHLPQPLYIFPPDD